MSLMTDPYDALQSFIPALKSGAIQLTQCEDKKLKLHRDMPLPGVFRWTYALMKNDQVTAIAIFTPADEYEGAMCFAIGYAVPKQLRRKGYATNVVRKSIKQFQAEMAAQGLNRFFVEAVIGTDNLASQGVARVAIAPMPSRSMRDSISGQPAVQYLREVGDLQY